MKKKLILMLWLLFAFTASKATSTNNYILCINSNTNDSPWSNRIIRELADYTLNHPDIELSVEHIRQIFLNNQDELSEFKYELTENYGKKKPKALVLLGGFAFTLVQEYREMWGDIPILLYASRDYVGDIKYYLNDELIPTERRIPIQTLSEKYNTVLFYTNLYLKESIEYIKQVQPKAEEILFVRDSRQVNEDIQADLTAILEQHYPEICLHSIQPKDMDTNELLIRMNQLDRTKTAILFSSWYYTVETKQGLEANTADNTLISLCKNPIFSLNLSDLTTFGGRMSAGYTFDFKPFSARFTDVLNQIIYEGKQPRDIPHYYPTTGRPYALYNIATRKGLTVKDFPKNTIFRNVPPSFFDTYQIEITITISLLTIAVLLNLFRIRLLKTKEKAANNLIEKQEHLIENLNMSLKSANIVCWKRNEVKRTIALTDHTMHESAMSLEEAAHTFRTQEEYQRFEDFIKELTENEVKTITLHLKQPESSEYKPYEISGMAVKSESGEVIETYGITRDISESHDFHQQLTEKVKLLETIEESLPIGLSIYDKEAKLCSSNQAMAKFLGIDRNKSIEQKANLFINTDKLHPILKNLTAGQTIHIPFSYKQIRRYIAHFIIPGAPHGEYFDIRCTPIVNEEGETEGYVSICIDTTEQTRNQEELRIAKEKAEISEKLKMAFLANMSHEIRTPLNAIVGFSELLQTTDDPTEREEYMAIVNSNNKLLLRLIGDILDLSRLESGSVELRPETFDFSAFFEETYNTLKPRCEDAKLTLKVDNPFSKCIVTLDKNRCLQIITNYLNNAIKFTPQGSIRMRYNYQDNGLMIAIEDNGIGISNDKLEKLFQRFEKLDTFAQGTGLGLSICKAIAITMGGKVGVKSTEGKGSTFWVWIPCQAEIRSWGIDTLKQLRKRTIPADEEREELGNNLLVAEDNDSNFLLLKAMLKECHLTRAKNGEEAVALAQKKRYDAILMDIRMPIMDGLEATKRIRTFDKETTIVAITANAFDSDKISALAAGCNNFVTKPLKRKEVEWAIRMPQKVANS